MKSEDISKMTSAALVTLVIAVAAFGPEFIGFGDADAAGDTGGIGAAIERPRLVSEGVEMRLTPLNNRTFKEGDEPVFELTAANTTDEVRTVTVETLMTSTSRPSGMSRTLARPVALWQIPLTLSLGPRETKAAAESTHTKLPAGSRVDVYLRTANAAGGVPGAHTDLTTMISFSTAVEQPAPR